MKRLSLPMFNTDPQLVRRCLYGKPDAFATLYDRHAPRVFRLLRHLTGSVSQAEDLTQETFLAAYQSLANWRSEGEFGTWLCGIAYRRYANACRSRDIDTELLDTHQEIAAPDSDPLLHCTRRERERMLEQTISRLPAVCREAFVLVKVEGLAYREAAHLLDVPIGTIQSRLWRAVRLLQAALVEEYPSNARTQTAAASEPSTPPAHPEDDSAQSSETRQGRKRYVV